MSMGYNIRHYRERAKLYQSDLGKALGVSAQAVSKWELGKAEPDLDSLIKMCELFDVSADVLIGRISEQDAISMETRDGLLLDEKRVIDLYRRLSDEGKEFVFKALLMAQNTMQKDDTGLTAT